MQPFKVYDIFPRFQRIGQQVNFVQSLNRKNTPRVSTCTSLRFLTTVEFRFGDVVLIEKLVFSVAYEKIGVAGSHFGTHGHTVDLFIITVSE